MALSKEDEQEIARDKIRRETVFNFRRKLLMKRGDNFVLSFVLPTVFVLLLLVFWLPIQFLPEPKKTFSISGTFQDLVTEIAGEAIIHQKCPIFKMTEEKTANMRNITLNMQLLCAPSKFCTRFASVIKHDMSPLTIVEFLEHKVDEASFLVVSLENEKELIATMTNATINGTTCGMPIFAGIVIDEDNDENFSYRIRPYPKIRNYRGTHFWDDLKGFAEPSIHRLYQNELFYEGIMTIQKAVNNAVISKKKQHSIKKERKIHEIKKAAALTEVNWSIRLITIANYVVLLPTILLIVSSLVAEKENGYKDYLMACGMTRRNNLVVQLACNIPKAFFSPHLVHGLFMLLMNGSGIQVLALMYVLDFLYILAFSFVIAASCTKRQHAIWVSVIAWTIMNLHALYIPDGLDAIQLCHLVNFAAAMKEMIRITALIKLYTGNFHFYSIIYSPTSYEKTTFVIAFGAGLVNVLMMIIMAYFLEVSLPGNKGTRSRLIRYSPVTLFTRLKKFIKKVSHRKNVTITDDDTTLQHGFWLEEVALAIGANMVFDTPYVKLNKAQVTTVIGESSSGKSVLLKALVGLLPPRTGWMKHHNTYANKYFDVLRRMTSYCPKENLLFDELTVQETLELFAGLKGRVYTEKMGNTAMERVQMKDMMEVLVATLSESQKRRLSLGIAILVDSEILVLDHPTRGLKTHSKHLFWKWIRNIRETKTIIISTSCAIEAEAIGDRVLVMKDGVVHSCGHPAFSKKNFGPVWSLTLKVKGNMNSAPRKILAEIQKLMPLAEFSRKVAAKSFSFHLGRPTYDEYFEVQEAVYANKDLNVKSHRLTFGSFSETFQAIHDGNYEVNGRKPNLTQMAAKRKALIDDACKTLQVTPRNDRFYCALLRGYGLVAKRFKLVSARIWKNLVYLALPIALIWMALYAVENFNKAPALKAGKMPIDLTMKSVFEKRPGGRRGFFGAEDHENKTVAFYKMYDEEGVMITAFYFGKMNTDYPAGVLNNGDLYYDVNHPLSLPSGITTADSMDAGVKIVTKLDPLPNTEKKKVDIMLEKLRKPNVIFILSQILIAWLAILPAESVMLHASERNCGAHAFQLYYGVSMVSIWIVDHVFEIFLYLLRLLPIIGTIVYVQKVPYGTDWITLTVVLAANVVPSVISSSMIASFFPTNPSNGYIVVLCWNLLQAVAGYLSSTMPTVFPIPGQIGLFFPTVSVLRLWNRVIRNNMAHATCIDWKEMEPNLPCFIPQKSRLPQPLLMGDNEVLVEVICMASSVIVLALVYLVYRISMYSYKKLKNKKAKKSLIIPDVGTVAPATTPAVASVPPAKTAITVSPIPPAPVAAAVLQKPSAAPIKVQKATGKPTVVTKKEGMLQRKPVDLKRVKKVPTVTTGLTPPATSVSPVTTATARKPPPPASTAKIGKPLRKAVKPVRKAVKPGANPTKVIKKPGKAVIAKGSAFKTATSKGSVTKPTIKPASNLPPPATKGSANKPRPRQHAAGEPSEKAPMPAPSVRKSKVFRRIKTTQKKSRASTRQSFMKTAVEPTSTDEPVRGFNIGDVDFGEEESGAAMEDTYIEDDENREASSAMDAADDEPIRPIVLPGPPLEVNRKARRKLPDDMEDGYRNSIVDIVVPLPIKPKPQQVFIAKPKYGKPIGLNMLAKTFELKPEVSRRFPCQKKGEPVVVKTCEAVKDANFSVYRGCTALIGSSASGKNTVLKMCTGEVKPTKGSVFVCGVDVEVENKKARPLFGFNRQTSIELVPDLTARQMLSFTAHLKGIPMKKNKDVVSALVTLLRLENSAWTLCCKLTYGARRKVCLGMAMIGNPEVLFLHSITDGIDSNAKRYIIDALNYNKLRGQTMLISTNDEVVAEDLCDEFAVMKKGKVAEVAEAKKIFAKKFSECKPPKSHRNRRYHRANSSSISESRKKRRMTPIELAFARLKVDTEIY